jgi:hypothetical protein
MNAKQMAQELLNIEAACLMISRKCERMRKELNVPDEPKPKAKKDFEYVLEKKLRPRIQNAGNSVRSNGVKS